MAFVSSLSLARQLDRANRPLSQSTRSSSPSEPHAPLRVWNILIHLVHSPIIFEEGHGFTAGQVGLTFLSILVGIVLVGAFACPLQERYYQRKIREGGGSTVPESRLPLMMICSLLLREFSVSQPSCRADFASFDSHLPVHLRLDLES